MAKRAVGALHHQDERGELLRERQVARVAGGALVLGERDEHLVRDVVGDRLVPRLVGDLAPRLVEVGQVVQDGVTEDEVERGVGEREPVAIALDEAGHEA